MEEIINPFQSGSPLRIERTYLFKGRQLLATEIQLKLLGSSTSSIVLRGPRPRCCGKTSFLLNLPRFLPNVIPVYFNLRNVHQTRSESDFCYGLVRAMGGDMLKRGLNPPTANYDEFRASPCAALEDWLDETEEALEFLLCFDNFEKLGNIIRLGIISERQLKYLFDLIQYRNELSSLFCGRQTLDELGPYLRSYFISVEPVEMFYLEPKEAKELLIDPSPEFNLSYDTGIIDEVLQITRCRPYLVQLIGEAMVSQANLHQTRLITFFLLEAALEWALTAGYSYFSNLWYGYTGAPDKPDEVAAGRRFLYFLAHNGPCTLPDSLTIRNAIRRMERYHVCEQDDTGGYRFCVPFFKRWVRERVVNEQ